jgi:hypothetical protein
MIRVGEGLSFKKNDPDIMSVDDQTAGHDVFVLYIHDPALFKMLPDSVLKKAARVAGKNLCPNQSD